MNVAHDATPSARIPPLGYLVRFTAYTGLRAGEVAALKVGRLDVVKGRVEVAESIERVTAVGARLKPTKTYERRTVPSPRFLCDDMAELVIGRSAESFVFRAPGGLQRSVALRKGLDAAGRPSGIAASGVSPKWPG